jgi:hypothetical protein
MKMTYKGLEIIATLSTDSKDEVRFVHVTTGQECEMFDQVFAGWSSQDAEENNDMDKMIELFRLNSDDVYLYLFDELDVDLSKYDDKSANYCWKCAEIVDVDIETYIKDNDGNIGTMAYCQKCNNELYVIERGNNNG